MSQGVNPLVFDPSRHEYRVRGVPVPSVTQILRTVGLRNSYQRVLQSRLEHASARGTTVHEICEALDRDDWTGEHDRLDAVNYVAAYERFCRDLDYRPEETEVRLYHHGLGYAGTADMVGWVRGQRVLIDRKTEVTLHRSVWLQLAGYQLAWEAMYPDRPLTGTYALTLRPDAQYRLLANPLGALATHYFIGVVWVYRFLQLQGL